MTTTAAAPAVDEYQHIPIDKLHPSKLNPRKHFDSKALKDLEDSIRSHGVMTPLLVRPNQKGFEIAAGERRFRAAKAAGLAELPARIREMDDIQFLEIMTVENLQREDVHPLEEADGYRQLMETGKYDVDAIAAKVGKSKSYVYQRLKLTELTKPARQLFLEQEITAGHAILLARLSETDQKTALGKNSNILYRNFGSAEPVSVRELARRIKERLYLKLSAAPWRKADPDLLPSAGACTACPKRSGNAPALFDDLDSADVCTDRSCFEKKLDAFIGKAVADGALPLVSEGWGRNKLPRGVLARGTYQHLYGQKCKSAERALVVDGYDRGKKINICRDKECPEHGGRTSSPRAYAPTAAEKAAEQKRKDKEWYESERRRRIAVELLEKAPAKPSRVDLEVIVSAYWERLWHEHKRLIGSILGWDKKQLSKLDAAGADYVKKAKASELLGFALLIALASDLGDHGAYYRTSGEPSLFATAKRLGINHAALSRSVKKELEERKAKRAARKKAAKKKARKKTGTPPEGK